MDPDNIRRRYEAELTKREGTPAPQHSMPLAPDPFTTPEPRDPIHTETDVLIIGAGFAGMMAGARLVDKKYLILDQAGDFGGTWYYNRYPGAQCDVESYVYFPMLEETGYVPSSRYPMAPETFSYCQHFARHFGLYDHALFHTGATHAQWDGARWIVRTNRGDTIAAQFVVRSNGGFGAPALPELFGLSTFPGPTFHSSRWDYTFTGGSPTDPSLTGLRGKRVAVVGSGASAVQIIPAVAEYAEHVYAVQRTPGPAIGTRDTTPTDVEWFRSQPAGWLAERALEYDLNTSGFLQDEDPVQDNFTVHARRLLTAEDPELEDMAIMGEIRDYIDSAVSDPLVADALKPWYSRRCKRVTFDDGYFAAFNRDNVTLVDAPVDGLERISGSTLCAGGQSFDADCIIFATGYDTTSNTLTRTGLDVIGRGGERSSGLRTLHGAMVDGSPNMFQIGTSQNALTANFTSGIATQVEHILDILAETERRGSSVVEPTPEATAAWSQLVHDMAEPVRAAFSSCVPGYYNGYAGGDGAYTDQLYTGGITRFRELLAEWRTTGNYEGLVFS